MKEPPNDPTEIVENESKDKLEKTEKVTAADPLVDQINYEPSTSSTLNNEDPDLAVKEELMDKILWLIQERETNRIRHDQKYIHQLQEYNYLKDGTMKLVELLSNIKKTSAKNIFEEFEIVDVDAGRWLGKSRFENDKDDKNKQK